MTDGAEYDRGAVILADLAELRARQDALTRELDAIHEGMGETIRATKIRMAIIRETGGEGNYEYRH